MSVATSNQMNQHFEEFRSEKNCDDETDEWKICRVCTDKATGYHFNAMTCEGCKGFFRRAIKGSKKFACAYEKSCPVQKANRRHCSACRFEKCLEVGMKKECIMTEAQIVKKRALIARNRMKRQAMTKSILSDDEIELIKMVTKSHISSLDICLDMQNLFGKRFFENDDSRSQEDILSLLGMGASDLCIVTIMRILFPMPPQQTSVIKLATDNGDILDSRLENVEGELQSVNMGYLRYFSNLMAKSFREIIEFSKNIPQFKELQLHDQIALIKGSSIEMLFIKTNYSFCLEDETFKFGNTNYNVESDDANLSEEFVDLYLNFHRKLKLLALNHEEFAMMMAICLFSPDRATVVDTNKVAQAQYELTLVLQNYCNSDVHPANGIRRLTVPHIISLLTTLRTLNSHIMQQMNKQPKRRQCNSPSNSMSSNSSHSSDSYSSSEANSNDSRYQKNYGNCFWKL